MVLPIEIVANTLVAGMRSWREKQAPSDQGYISVLTTGQIAWPKLFRPSNYHWTAFFNSWGNGDTMSSHEAPLEIKLDRDDFASVFVLFSDESTGSRGALTEDRSYVYRWRAAA